MEYIIKKTYNHDNLCFAYQAFKKPETTLWTADCVVHWLSPQFKTPEEVIDYMEKDQIEEFIDPKTIKRSEKL